MRAAIRAFVAAFAVFLLHAPALAHEGHVHPEHEEDEPVAETEQSGAGAVEAAAPVAAQSDHDAAAGHGGAPAPLRNLHPAVVHFPIGLLITAALAELLAMWRGSTGLAAAARVMTIAGGASAGVAALFGWMHTGLWFGGDGAMFWHRWVGTGLGVSGPLLGWLAWRRSGTSFYRAGLFAIAAILLWQGWLGAELSQGAGHLWM